MELLLSEELDNRSSASLVTSVPNDSIANLEKLNVGASLADFASHIASDHSRPLLNEHAAVRHVPVNRVDGNGSIADYDLSRSSFGEGSISNDQWGTRLVEVSGLVLHN